MVQAIEPELQEPTNIVPEDFVVDYRLPTPTASTPDGWSETEGNPLDTRFLKPLKEVLSEDQISAVPSTSSTP